jgi:SAM-dependent methyltransferase
MDMHNPNSWAGLNPPKNQEERQQLIEEYSHIWNLDNEFIQNAFDNHQSDLRLFIKYEELKKNTKHELKKIYDFINVKITDEELNFLIDKYDFKNIPNSEKGQGKFNREASTGGWKKTFNQNEISLMENIMDQSLTKFEYELETNNMIHYNVIDTDIIKENSKRFFAKEGEMYECTFNAIGINGHPYSTYLGLVFFDEFDNEIRRRKKFITDYSGKLKQYVVRALAPINTKYCKLLYRINTEGAKKSHSKLRLQYILSIKIETSSSHDELYDNDFDYKEEWKDYDEKKYWEVIGARSYKEYQEMGKSKFDILKNTGLKPNSTVLDIGCGTGSLIENLKNFLLNPTNYVGIDIANESIIYCKKNFPDSVFYKTNIGEIPEINRKFDFVALFSVFPHMYPDEIKNQLLRIKSFLKNNGCIIASIVETTITPTFVGTRSTIELNSNFFIDLIKSCGYTHIEKISSPYQSGDFTQIVFSIRI